MGWDRSARVVAGAGGADERGTGHALIGGWVSVLLVLGAGAARGDAEPKVTQVDRPWPKVVTSCSRNGRHCARTERALGRTVVLDARGKRRWVIPEGAQSLTSVSEGGTVVALVYGGLHGLV